MSKEAAAATARELGVADRGWAAAAQPPSAAGNVTRLVASAAIGNVRAANTVSP